MLACVQAAQHAPGSAVSAAGHRDSYQPGRAGTGAGQLVIDEAATQAQDEGLNAFVRCSSQRALA